MKLTLSELSTLIELTELKQKELLKSINDPNISDDIADADAELLVQIGNTTASLESQYNDLWSKDCNYASYDDLLKRINNEA